MPQTSTSTKQLRLFSPWTTRKTLSQVRLSLISNQTPWQPNWSKRASSSPLSCDSTASTSPPLSATFPPLKDSVQLALQMSFLSSDLIRVKWLRPHFNLHQKRWDALSLLWQSHVHAHHGGPISDPHGHWPMGLLGFMVYIQQQISSFTVGVSVKMNEKLWFWNL